MNELIKIVVIKEFWYEGRHYIKGECLFFVQEIINKIGSEHFEIIKALKHPPKNKMMYSYAKK